jgi:hypothetical protein
MNASAARVVGTREKQRITGRSRCSWPGHAPRYAPRSGVTSTDTRRPRTPSPRQNRGYEHSVPPQHPEPKRIKSAGDLVAGLIRAGGFEPFLAGGLDQSIRIEMFGDLHEYGALGRTVTRTEALKAI